MSIEVRIARPDEYEDAGEVTALAYHEFVRPGEPNWEEYLARIADVAGRAARTTILIAVEDGRVLGSATLELEGRVSEQDEQPLAPGEAHIRMLGVHPRARRRGIATLLMDACLRAARDAGTTFVTLHTTHRMQAAQRMYASLGFERLEDRVFPDGFVLLTYTRPVDPPLLPEPSP